MKKLVILIVMLVSFLAVAPPSNASAENRIVQAAFQTFERGFMIWQGDTGAIWVLSNSGMILNYPEASYAALPDNPIPDTSGTLVYPVSGFGRVWGNFSTVRNLLGWGLEEEYAYSLTVETDANGSVTLLDLPDGRDIQLVGNRWSFTRTSPRPISEIPQIARIPVTFQTFEGGYMMWWSDTGSIWVLYNNGQTEYFASERYGRLSENPIPIVAPTGRFMPIQGFGKVWGHFPHVRNRLGWGLEQVHAYVMDFERLISFAPTNNGFVYFRISFPDGRTVIMTDRNLWSFSN